MADIQVGDKVRILVNYSVKGHLWEPSNSSKHLQTLKAEHLKKQAWNRNSRNTCSSR